MKRTFVPPSGPSTALTAGVGEQPGKTEIFGHPPRPFIGDAGKGLDECLQMTKISRNSLYLTNVIKDLDAPLGHYIYVDEKNHYTIFGEGQQYIAELKDELQSMPNLNCVIAFGNVPLIALCNRIGINKWRGSVLESTLVPGLKVIPTFHPATIVRPKFQHINKQLICEDLLRVKRESTFHHIQRIPRAIIIVKSFNEAISYLKHAYEVGLKGLTISIDIEVLNHEVDCFSIGWSPTDACCIHFTGPGGDYYNPEEELEIMKYLGYILESERISKVGANFIFDTQFLFRKYGIEPKGPINCTQIAQKISFPDFPAGLDFVTSMYTDIPYYKADGKEWIKMGAGSWEEWWNYNALDSIVPSEAFPRQVQTLNKQHNFETYLEQAKLIKPLTYMGEKGIRINVQGMIEFQKTETAKLDELAIELRSEVGYDINYNSPPQLMNYFYKEQGLEPYKKKNNSGKYTDTIDVDALKRIFRRKIGKVSHVAEIMLDIRSLTKRISTYLNINKIDPDGRMRSSYKPAGTETGRPASGKTIFGTGTNQQNWPHDLLQFFLADEGYMLYSIDLSQIENRIVAYTGNVIPQIEAFEQGKDLHRLTASWIVGKPYDEVSDEDGSSPLGDGRQSERYWGKKGNHATNYDVQFKTFALKNEMGETEAKVILENIHRAYPQIRGGYHVMIQNMLLNENRTVTNLYGRTRLFLGPIVESYPNVTKYAVADTFREAYAHFAQSTCADKIIRQGVNYIYYNQDLFKDLEMLTEIHDSIVFQIPLSIPFLYHAEVILLIKQSLEQPLEWKGRTIPILADLAIGYNMYKKQQKEFKSKNIPNDKYKLAELIEGVYQTMKPKMDELYYGGGNGL